VRRFVHRQGKQEDREADEELRDVDAGQRPTVYYAVFEK
jgi:hypothetical protein